jgi:hypothetical protein
MHLHPVFTGESAWLLSLRNDYSYGWGHPCNYPNSTNVWVKNPFRKIPKCPVLVAHACNPSYSGGRDQEDCSLKPAQGNSSRDPISKTKPSQKRLVE